MSEKEELTDLNKVNELLRKGYSLASVEYRPVFLLRKDMSPLKTEEKPKPSLAWESLQWHTPLDMPGFAWTFAIDKQGKILPETTAFVEALIQGPIKEGKYEYSLSSNGKFLRRIEKK